MKIGEEEILEIAVKTTPLIGVLTSCGFWRFCGGTAAYIGILSCTECSEHKDSSGLPCTGRYSSARSSTPTAASQHENFAWRGMGLFSPILHNRSM